MRPEAPVLYLDSSALVKLVIAEAETPALEGLIQAGALVATSALAEVEVRRAVLRHGGEQAVAERAEGVLGSCTLIELHRAVLARAGALRPGRLRALDAVHLATALELGPELHGFVAYDLRLCDAASAAGLPLLTPGA